MVAIFYRTICLKITNVFLARNRHFDKDEPASLTGNRSHTDHSTSSLTFTHLNISLQRAARWSEIFKCVNVKEDVYCALFVTRCAPHVGISTALAEGEDTPGGIARTCPRFNNLFNLVIVTPFQNSASVTRFWKVFIKDIQMSNLQIKGALSVCNYHISQVCRYLWKWLQNKWSHI